MVQKERPHEPFYFSKEKKRRKLKQRLGDFLGGRKLRF